MQHTDEWTHLMSGQKSATILFTCESPPAGVFWKISDPSSSQSSYYFSISHFRYVSESFQVFDQIYADVLYVQVLRIFHEKRVSVLIYFV